MGQPTPTTAAVPLPATAIRLGWTSFLTDLGSETVAPLLPMLLSGFPVASAVWIGAIEGGADGLASVLKRFSGRWSDRMARRKPLVVAGYGLAGAVRPLMALATAPWHVLAIRLTDRVGKGLRSAPRDALLADCAPRGHEGRVFGFQRAMDHAGAVLGPLVAALLLELHWPLAWVFALTIVPGVLAVAMVARIVEPARAVQTKPVNSASSPPAELPAKLRSFVGIAAVFALGNSPDALILLRALELGAPASALPLLWSGLHVVKVVASRYGGMWADRVPKVRVVLAGWAVYALCYLGFAVCTEVAHVAAVLAVYGVYHGLCEPAERALVKELAPPDQRGQAYGAFHMATGLAALPAGLVAGWLWQEAGAGAALGLGAVVAVVSGVALLVWQRRWGR